MEKELSKEAKLLLEFKQESGFSYEKLGHEIGVCGMTIYRWCKGRQEPSLIAKRLIKDYLLKVRLG